MLTLYIFDPDLSDVHRTENAKRMKNAESTFDGNDTIFGSAGKPSASDSGCVALMNYFDNKFG